MSALKTNENAEIEIRFQGLYLCVRSSDLVNFVPAEVG
jgi:hypothetical protein